MSWLVLLGTLLGTVIGSIGTIVSQHLAGRAAERRERLARVAEYRTERLRVNELLIDIGQEVERVAVEQSGPSRELHDRLWTMQARLAILAPDRFLEPLREWVDALNHVHWHGPPDGQQVWEYLTGPRARFIEAARVELGTGENGDDQ
jgi:hypothetical protein